MSVKAGEHLATTFERERFDVYIAVAEVFLNQAATPIDEAVAAISAIAGPTVGTFRDDAAPEQFVRAFGLLRAACRATHRVPEIHEHLDYRHVVEVVGYIVWERVWPGAGADEPAYGVSATATVRRGTVWAVDSAKEVKRLRAAVKPGQVWINASDINVVAWPVVRAWAQHERRRLRLGGHPGRPRSDDPRLDELREWMRPGLKNAEIHAKAVSLGLRDGPYSEDGVPIKANKAWVTARKREIGLLSARQPNP